MKNYFDYETRVKFYEAIMSQKKDWQWIIDIVENEFEEYGVIQCWGDFLKKSKKIIKVYEKLIQINKIENVRLNISKPWLKQINLCSMLYCRQKTIQEIWPQLTDIFSQVFAIMVYVTSLLNTANQGEQIFNVAIFSQDNLYKILNLEDIICHEKEIEFYLLQIELNDIRMIVDCWRRNLHKVEMPPEVGLLELHKHELVAVNVFDFHNIELPYNTSWEIQCIFEMVSTKFDGNELVPILVNKGIPYPNVALWNEELLNDLIVYFKNDIASFVIETIRYFLYNTPPSDKIISKHFELLIENLSELNKNANFYDIENSSFYVINRLISNKQLNNCIKNKYVKNYFGEIQKFVRPETIFKLKESKTCISEEQKEILEKHNSNIVNSIYSVFDIYGFIKYCKNEFVWKNIKNGILLKVVEIFNNLIKEETNSVSIAKIFYEFLVFLIKLLSCNINVSQDNIKNYVIQLQQLWQTVYFSKCSKAMDVIATEQEINSSVIEDINDKFLKDSIAVVSQCMPVSGEGLLKIIVEISKHPLTVLCSHIQVTEFYPKSIEETMQLREVDKGFEKIIDRLQKDNGYKMYNYIEPKKLLYDIYSQYSFYLKFYLGIFYKDEDLYNKVKNKIHQYSLIDYDGTNLYPAHLLQLFPILENKIREFGMKVNIVPFKETAKEFFHLKNASNVLQQILMEIFSQTHSFDVVRDFFFIYQCMYSSNLLNIRNECSHGRDYLNGEKMLFAFKTTLICLDLVLTRLETLEINIENNY